jgi:hypothetical protein
MLTNDLIKLFLPIITNGLIARSLLNIQVKQAYQPTQQGANLQSTIYFHELDTILKATLYRKDAYDPDMDVIIHTEEQYLETSFQVDARSIQNPANTDQLTATDLARVVANILQSDLAVKILRSSDVYITKISKVRNLQVKNDFDNFESCPSFDFTLLHTDINLTEEFYLTGFENNIHRVA